MLLTSRVNAEPEVTLMFIIENNSNVLYEDTFFYLTTAVNAEIRSTNGIDLSAIEEVGNNSGGKTLIFKTVPQPPFSRYQISVTLRVSRIDEGEWESETAELKNVDVVFVNAISKMSVNESNSTRSNAKYIHSWIEKNISNDAYRSDVKGAEWAFKNRRGDCTEQALLYVALARAAGLPARVMGGYIVERSGRVFGKDYHNWAEVYVEGKWLIADPFYGVFDQGYEKYIATQVVDYDNPDADNRRFWIEGGEGIKVTML